MFVRYLPVIFVLLALVLALAPIEAAGQPAPAPAGSPDAKLKGKDDDQARPLTAGAPVDAGAGNKAAPPGADARQVRPAQAFPPERIAPSGALTPQAPSRGGVQTPDRTQGSPAAKDDPRSREEQPDPGG